MKDTTVAARYARALFLLTEKRGETVRALEDLKSLWSVVKPGTPVGRLLSTPQVLLSDKRRVLQTQLEGKCLKSVALFLDLLLRKTRLVEMETIVGQYEALVEKQQGIERVTVTSAVPMTAAELERLRVTMQQQRGTTVLWAPVALTFGTTVRLTNTVDESLVGGAAVRFGDHVLDRSVHSLLEAIGRQLYETSV